MLHAFQHLMLSVMNGCCCSNVKAPLFTFIAARAQGVPLDELERCLGADSAAAAALKKLRADAKLGTGGQSAQEIALAQVRLASTVTRNCHPTVTAVVCVVTGT